MDKMLLAARASLVIGAVVCATIVSAQHAGNSSSSGVEILKLRWHKQVRVPNNYDPAIIPTRGVFVDPASKAPAALPGSGIDAPRPTSNPNTSVDSNIFFPTTPRRLPVFYLYSMKIKNTNAKRIEGVAWSYEFLDRETKSQLGRHEFLSYRKISPGAAGLLENPLRSPPVRVINASEDQPAQPKMTERATIECVLFSDETTWRNGVARESVCNALIKGNPAKRKPPAVPRQN
jgi:hypothetical protein